ncbi:DinB family protein [Paenibacillus sp. WQ 127069]|uniref:DinB family protein n=1 Tax=Paenibacillus baimaensis TaxID=2982185 RepID=A0ABT2UPD4_9BACL|nr:DinB family protein [Paenibacillus sp. WQ 127069]MCU6796502.1 DinB family protein [Paenibacillus sp. WQ 127069]
MSEITLRSIHDFRATYALIQQAIEGLSEGQLVWKPAVDKWSIKEVAAHLVDASLVHSIRIRKIVAEGSAQLPPFLLYDQDAWVADSRANETSIAEILSAFQAILHYNALFYERLTEADWSKKGLNGEKEVTISDLFQGFINHVNIHVRQIDRNKAAWSAK